MHVHTTLYAPSAGGVGNSIKAQASSPSHIKPLFSATNDQVIDVSLHARRW